MIPHYAYYPCDHGYYYFRPYNVSHIRPQQAMAASWGADPRNPYGNEIFEKIYAEHDAAKAKAPAPKPKPGSVK